MTPDNPPILNKKTIFLAIAFLIVIIIITFLILSLTPTKEYNDYLSDEPTDESLLEPQEEELYY